MKELNLDRRHFIGGAATAALAAAALGATGCASQASSSTAPAADAGSLSSSSAAATGGGHTWEVAPEPIPASEIGKTIDADVVVIGAGVAGLICAHSAAMNGADVLLVEKMDTFSARGHDNGAINTKYQTDKGFTFDKTQMQKDYLQLTAYKTNINLWQVWADYSGEAVDYYVDRMAEVGVTELSNTKPVNMDSDNVTIKEYPTGIDFGATQVTEDGEGIQHRFLRYVEQWAKDEGVDIHYNTKAEQLVREGDGPVTGVICSTDDGYVQFNGANGVVLATGDISGNEEMLEVWAPIALKCENKLYSPPGANTGDGINMACWVGAAPQKTNAAIMALPSAKAKGGPLASDGVVGWLGVNLNGERYFAENAGGPSICFATMQQPNAAGYSIFDGEYETKIMIQSGDGKNRSGVDYLGDKYGVSEGFEGLEDWMAKGKEDGTFFEADTIEDLAKQVGIDPAALQNTIDEYNEMCAAGVDTQYGVPANNLTAVETPPFYASKIKAAVLVVPFGVNVNSQSMVCDVDDNPIQNLYAIGNVQGNFLTDSYPMIFSGISHGRAIAFGWALGRALAKGETI